MDKIPKICVLLYVCIATGCNEDMSFESQVPSSSGTVFVEIKKIKSVNETGSEKSLVYGDVRFEKEKSSVAKADLTCISISTGEAVSEIIIVDSVAHILPDRYLLKSDKVSVYWKMNKKIDAGSVDGFKVSIREGCHVLRQRDSSQPVLPPELL